VIGLSHTQGTLDRFEMDLGAVRRHLDAMEALPQPPVRVRRQGSTGEPRRDRTPAYPAEVALVVPMRLVWIGMIVGSAVGGYLPALWGGDLFSFRR
jgi:hypothetical protein